MAGTRILMPARKRIIAGALALIAGLSLAAPSADAQIKPYCNKTVQGTGIATNVVSAKHKCTLYVQNKANQRFGGTLVSLHQTSMSCKQAQGGTWTCTCSAVVCSRPEMKQFKHGLPSPIGFQTNTKRRRDRGRNTR